MKIAVCTPLHTLPSAEQIQAARELLRWQQIELADRAGIDIAKLEAGEIEARTLRLLAVTLLDHGIDFATDGRPMLDGRFYNSRTEEGIPTVLTERTPPQEKCSFRYPPLPHPNEKYRLGPD
jgi:transcriptional regulator with XRE-family HTH domain